MASALLGALAIPAAEMNKEMLRPQFSQLGTEPPGCQTRGSCMATSSYSIWDLLSKTNGKRKTLGRPEALLAVQPLEALTDTGLLVLPFIQVTVIVLK